MLKGLTLTLILIGYLCIAVFGTGVKDVFQWPGLLLIGIGFMITPIAFKDSRNIFGHSICNLSVGLVFIYMLIRALTSPVAHEASLEILLILVLFGFYLLFCYWLIEEKYRIIFAGILILLACGNTGVAIYQLDNPEFHILPGYDRVGLGGQLERPSGFYNASPHMGGFLQLVSIISAAFFLFLKQKIQRSLFLILCVIAIGGVILSQSRGSMIALPIGLSTVFLFYLIFNYRSGHSKKGNRARTFLAIICGLCAVLGLGLIMINDISHRVKSVDHFFADASRSNFRSGAVDQWMESPLFGTGSRTFQHKYLQYRPQHAPFHQMDPKFAHNDYLQQLAEYGLIGLLLVIFCLFLHLLTGFKLANITVKSIHDHRSRIRFALLIGAVAVLVAHSLHAVVDFHIRLLATAVPIIFCISIISSHSMSSVIKHKKSLSLMFQRWAIGIIGLTIIILGFLIAPSSWKIQQAKNFLNKGEPAMAISLLHDASEINPNNATAFRELARLRYEKLDDDIPTLVKIGYAENALEAFKRALELNPLDWRSLLGAGVCEIFLAWHANPAMSDSYWIKAEEFLKKAIQVAPTKYEPREEYAYYKLNLAYYMASNGNFDGAYKEAVSAAKKFEAVPEFFVEGAPRGHRVAEGTRSSKQLLERLKKS